MEKRLAELPVITVPTITMEGDSNGAVHVDSAAYRDKLSGKYEYRLITGGVVGAKHAGRRRSKGMARRRKSSNAETSDEPPHGKGEL